MGFCALRGVPPSTAFSFPRSLLLSFPVDSHQLSSSRKPLVLAFLGWKGSGCVHFVPTSRLHGTLTKGLLCRRPGAEPLLHFLSLLTTRLV